MCIEGQLSHLDENAIFNGLVRIIDIKKYGYIYEGQAYEYKSSKPRKTPSLRFDGFGRLIHNMSIYYMGEFKDGVKHGLGKHVDLKHPEKCFDGIWDMGVFQGK